MTEDEFLAARDLMAEAVARAIKVVGYVSGDDEFAKVDLLENGEAILTSRSSDYEGYSSTEEQTFPGHLLFCSDAEVDAWLAAKKAKQDADRAASIRADAARQLAQEKAVYAALKAKYG